HAEGGERPPWAAGAHTDLEAPAAELVECAQALGQVHRAVQGGDEHGAAQPQPPRARGRVGHHLDRPQLRRPPEQILLGPGAVEAELLGAGQLGGERRVIELTVGKELRDRDREPHSGHRSRARAGAPQSVATSAEPAASSTVTAISASPYRAW